MPMVPDDLKPAIERAARLSVLLAKQGRADRIEVVMREGVLRYFRTMVGPMVSVVDDIDALEATLTGEAG